MTRFVEFCAGVGGGKMGAIVEVPGGAGNTPGAAPRKDAPEMRDKSILTPCSVPDCGKPALARGWCSAHYHRWLRGNDPLAPPASVNQRSYVLPIDADTLRREYLEQGLSQDEIAERHGVSQKVVWKAMQHAGIAQRPSIKRDQRLEKNDSWKGGRLFYPKHDERAVTRHGHRRGYYKIKDDAHPHANKQGYVWEHVYVALRAAGRERLAEGEVVHHINCDPLDNRPENLCILQDQRHRQIHASLEQVIGELVDRGLVRFSPEEGYVVAEGEEVMPNDA